MVDHITSERRSWLMSRVKSKHTTPELLVRSMLHKMGYRFRLHSKNLPGKPDIVLPKYKTAIFVHGCFWHGHTGCPKATGSKTNVEFWENKFQANIARFKKVSAELKSMGWKVAVVWQCETKDQTKLLKQLKAIFTKQKVKTLPVIK